MKAIVLSAALSWDCNDDACDDSWVETLATRAESAASSMSFCAMLDARVDAVVLCAKDSVLSCIETLATCVESAASSMSFWSMLDASVDAVMLCAEDSDANETEPPDAGCSTRSVAIAVMMPLFAESAGTACCPKTTAKETQSCVAGTSDMVFNGQGRSGNSYFRSTIEYVVGMHQLCVSDTDVNSCGRLLSNAQN